MKKNFKTQSPQHQLYFDLDETNTHPTSSGQSIEIHIHGKAIPDGKSHHLKDSRVGRRKRFLSDIQSKPFLANTYSHTHRQNKSFSFQESQLKTQMAHQILQWILEDQMSLNDIQDKIYLSEEKIESLMKGNLTKLSFYEVLESLTQFGFNALICLRPTEKQNSGKIIFEY